MSKNKIIAILAIIWNLLGLTAFVIHLSIINSPDLLSQLPIEQQPLYENQPVWYLAAFTLAVVAGTLGSILLLLNKPFAFPVFIASLGGVLAQQTYMHFMSDTFAVLGSYAMIMPSLVLVVALFLVFHSKNVE